MYTYNIRLHNWLAIIVSWKWCVYPLPIKVLCADGEDGNCVVSSSYYRWTKTWSRGCVRNFRPAAAEHQIGVNEQYKRTHAISSQPFLCGGTHASDTSTYINGSRQKARTYHDLRLNCPNKDKRERFTSFIITHSYVVGYEDSSIFISFLFCY